MPLSERVDQDLIQARRDRNEAALRALGLLKTEIVRASKDPGAGGAGDEVVLRLVRREVKRREEAAQAYDAAGRAGAAADERAESEVLRVYLPPQMDAADLEREVATVVRELGAAGPRDLGRVMKEARARLQDRADAGDIAQVARRLLAS
ncbi:MAG: GatB/YqeY domain-containing protein [Candidatus Dormibacteraeota bacterium]|nr:GatB/YqeY domain-containing protein [Candidatus Dormibacteraeota bacterium]MBO0744387.1 GatB/YqeY domain-containing protein [Candidatus Dormibacteraeota bacterium]